MKAASEGPREEKPDGCTEEVFDSLGYVTALTRWINRKIMRKQLVSGN
jgi:hypothetical protein